jgi:hypothetical protein
MQMLNGEESGCEFDLYLLSKIQHVVKDYFLQKRERERRRNGERNINPRLMMIIIIEKCEVKHTEIQNENHKEARKK